MTIVLDNSTTMAWCFVDEAVPYATAVFDRLRQTNAFVPAIWPLEVANGLLNGERRRRITEVRADDFLLVLQSLHITVDDGGVGETLRATLALARTYALSSYDASYLELAIRHRLLLATQDARLRAAAAQAGVALVE